LAFRRIKRVAKKGGRAFRDVDEERGKREDCSTSEGKCAYTKRRRNLHLKGGEGGREKNALHPFGGRHRLLFLRKGGIRH